jgi:peptide/nickel transport system permease protein
VVVNAEIINIDYVYENSELFMLTKDNSVYLMDLHLYEKAGYVSIGKLSDYNNETGEISLFPYPPGSKLTYFTFMGGLTGTKYSIKAAAFDIYGIYYCNDTNTVGLVILKGESLLPLPPGKYISGNWYIIGTDDKGHDLWTWLVYGSRVAFTVGILASFFSVMIGTLYGVYSGYKGGITDTLMMRFVDIMLTLPALPVLLILTSILGPSIWNIILVIALLGWSGIARVIRAQTLSLKSRPFVDAAKVAGASNIRIMLSHIFPNVLPFSFLYMTLGVAGAIISEASLSFLGLGDPKAISWGQMLYSIQTAGATMYAWWWLLPPGLSITLISLGFYLVGRAFDEILNPRLRKR